MTFASPEAPEPQGDLVSLGSILSRLAILARLLRPEAAGRNRAARPLPLFFLSHADLRGFVTEAKTESCNGNGASFRRQQQCGSFMHGNLRRASISIRWLRAENGNVLFAASTGSAHTKTSRAASQRFLSENVHQSALQLPRSSAGFRVSARRARQFSPRLSAPTTTSRGELSARDCSGRDNWRLSSAERRGVSGRLSCRCNLGEEAKVDRSQPSRLDLERLEAAREPPASLEFINRGASRDGRGNAE